MSLSDYKFLSKINSPKDLKNISEVDLPDLCAEIRDYMINTITKIGGHLGAGLGVVELTVALHYVFDTPTDKIIFDVGHQGYPHKILTGRKELLHTIRQKNGISGFLKINESEYDAFGAGHASTSISAALGIATARDFNKENFKTIAVIGDGAMTGGLAYEAMNNAGVHNRNLLVILNDNNISIDENISALSNYFNNAYSSNKVQSLKNNIYEIMGKGGSRGDRVRKLVSKLAGGVKSIITPGMTFEALGFDYFGPINGNNVHKLIKFLRNIKDLQGPLFLHVVTEKGKGYDLAEKDLRKLHAVGASKPELDTSSFNLYNTTSNINLSEQSKQKSHKKYQDVFGETIQKIMLENKKVSVISAAMIEGTGLEQAAKSCPDRVIDVGIAEGHAVTFAAGLATQNIIPVVAIYSSFLQRAFDNIIHDCALQNLHIVFAIDRAGLVGEDGATHHGVFDINYLRIIPNLILMAPKDGTELISMIYSAIYDFKSCVAIRYPRGKVPFPTDNKNLLNYPDTIDNIQNYSSLEIKNKRGEVLAQGEDLCLIAVGRMVSIALETREILLKNNINIEVVNARFIKPLDVDLLDILSKKHKYIITLEDGQKSGGFGSAVLEYLNHKKYNGVLEIFGIEDKFIEHGNVEDLLKEVELDAHNISKKIINILHPNNISNN